ncbi:sec31-related protein [Holotrichia oblita]|uniref:Sec31-related protein n=1 Tax=Holotrichia oblita TaxID=644536 RepID=A0ACB9SPD6_HOLOL|nr:sec31-related protein [Holotrichia oblita]
MKVKDIERTANIAWSSIKHPSILLAAGTAAQQFDASFSTNASLEIYSLNVSDPSLDTELLGNTSCEHRFHKIIWGSFGSSANGTVVGGCDNGIIQIYNVDKILAGESGLEASHSNHTGAVHALDFNPFQENLLATGASESEIYIWDMNNTSKPMTPGSKPQPFEDIVSIQWNKAVQPILAATFVSKCLVWDLQEDQAPTIQLWDLRFATQALNTFENHQRGILSMAWCLADPDLLISTGKDNRILCWNPNSTNPGGEVLSEIARTNQWNFDVSWCPKSPVLIGSPSFDGHVSVYTVMGGHSNKQIQTSNKIADSFPGMDGYLQAPVPQQTTHPAYTDVSKAPKWMKKPVSAKFGFGGKLIAVTTEKPQHNAQTGQMESSMHLVYISQVVTESELVNKSAQLEQAMEYGNFLDYCKNKADLTMDQHKKYIWHFLRAHFEENSQAELLNLLGYRLEDINNKLDQVVGNSGVDEISDGISNLHGQNDFNNLGGGDDFDRIMKTYEAKKQKQFEIKTGDDTEGLITEAILMGNIEAAVELCMKAKKYTEAIILARTGISYYVENDNNLAPLITSLINSDWNSIIDNCNIKNWKEALVAILRHCNDLEYPSLCERLGNRLLQESDNNPKLAQDAQLCFICSGSFDQLVNSWSGRAKHSTKDLQELVELVMLLKKAIEHQGRIVEIKGGLADILSEYAFILASQGNLQTALNYLGNSTSEQVVELRNRLFICLGQEPAYTQKRPSIASGYPQISPKTTYPSNPVYNHFNTNPISNVFGGGPPTPTWQAPPARTFSPAPPPQPARPPSAGSTTQSGVGLHSRAKYVLDPSVQSNTNMPSMNMNQNQVMPPMPTQPAFQANALNNYNANPYKAPVSNSLSQPALPPSPAYEAIGTYGQAPQQNRFMTTKPNPTFAPQPVNQFVPSSIPANVPPAAPPTFTQGVPASTGMDNPYAKPPPMKTDLGGSTPGWNDPPAFTKSAKSQPKSELASQDPITHPIYGTAPVSNTPNNMYGNPGIIPNQPSMYGQPLTQNNFNNYQPTMPPPGDMYNPAAFNTQAINPNAFATNAVNTNMNHQQNVMGTVEKPQPIPKAPIPEEHIHMQTVFDELRSRCSGAANNPQMKRKLDDVSRKLENLYDLLRERKLTPNTLTSLHQMCQMLQNGDYASIQRLQTELAESPDFSQVASFMPGIKVLLQCAQQLQVYLR